MLWFGMKTDNGQPCRDTFRLWRTRYGYHYSRRLAAWSYRHNAKRVARFIWRRMTGFCDLCGAHVMMHSVIWAAGFTCWPCHKAHE